MQEPADKGTPAQPGAGRWPFALLLIAGIALIAASRLDVFPAVSIATFLSADGTLTSSYISQLQHSQWILALALLAAAFFALWADRTFSFLAGALLNPSRAAFLSVLGLSGFGLALIVQTFLFSGIPHVTDAISHVFQAKILVLGRLWAPLPPCPESFFQHHIVMTVTGKWFSKYLPGHALLLAAGLKAGLLWAVVPLCSGIAAAALAWLTERFYGPLPGRLTGVLFVVSPIALLLGGSFMSHTTALACALLGGVCAVWAVDRFNHPAPSRSAAALGGFLLAWSAITRLPDAIIVTTIGFFAVLLTPPRFWKRCAMIGGFAVIGALPVLLFAGWWNHQLYGRVLALGYGAGDPSVLIPLYHDQYGLSASFTARQAFTIFMWTISRFSRALLGWPVSLIFIPIAFLVRRWERADVLCLLGCLLAPLVYFFYNYNGQEFEARYYFTAVPFALALTARGMKRAVELLRLKNEKAARAFVLALTAAFFLHGAVDYWAGYIIPSYSNDYEQTSPAVYTAAQRDELRNAVVFIPSDPPDGFRYSCGFLYNAPLLDASVIYARDRGNGDKCVEDAFPRRSGYRFVPNHNWHDGRFEQIF